MSIISPIGVFDSGLGGLTVAKRVLEKLPQESMVYVGDEIHVPYGERTPEQITSFALGICEFLVHRNAKLIIMACNMSSALALEKAQRLFPDIPIIGVIEAGVRAALAASSGGPIGILATRGTANTKAYTKTIQRFRPDAEVFEQACPLFVPIVEDGAWDTPEAEAAVREYTAPLLAEGCRTLVLGCTHYPFLTQTIKRIVGAGITLIDPSEETTVDAANIIENTGSASPNRLEPVHTYYTSAETERFTVMGGKFLGRAIEVEKITWEMDLRAIECQETTEDRMIKSAL